MRFGGTIEPLSGDLPLVEYQWDPDTEILTAVADGGEGSRGYTGSIELEDANGAVITLDLLLGGLRGVEVVVWPRVETDGSLEPPVATRTGTLVVPARPSQPGIAILELDVALAARRSVNESTLYFHVGPLEAVEVIQVADRLLIELDSESELAGIWLIDVPPFPSTERR